MTVGLTPIEYLKAKLTPLSGQIDASGGPHVLMGLIASGGQPHIYILGNVKGNLKKEIYMALSERLRVLADETAADHGLILVPGSGQLVQ